MKHKYEVRFAKSDPEIPPTTNEQIAIAREAARKLDVPDGTTWKAHERHCSHPLETRVRRLNRGAGMPIDSGSWP